jgi:hypothetical protein
MIADASKGAMLASAGSGKEFTLGCLEQFPRRRREPECLLAALPTCLRSAVAEHCRDWEGSAWAQQPLRGLLGPRAKCTAETTRNAG